MLGIVDNYLILKKMPIKLNFNFNFHDIKQSGYLYFICFYMGMHIDLQITTYLLGIYLSWMPP